MEAMKTMTQILPKDASTVQLMLKPLEMLLAAKYEKSYTHVLSIIQVLSAANLLQHDKKLTLLDQFLKLFDSYDDMIPIKILQILMIMITAEDVVQTTFSLKILNLSLKAFSSKSQVIKNTVFAVLRQLYSLLFNQYNKTVIAKGQNNDSQEIFELCELHQICAEQLEHLVQLAGEKFKYTNFKGLGLDLLSAIMSECKTSLAVSAVIKGLFEVKLTNILVLYLKNETNSFPIIIRTVKCATHLMLSTKQSYNLVNLIITLSTSPHSYLRYLSLEAFSMLLNDYTQIQVMHDQTNSITNMKVKFHLFNLFTKSYSFLET